MKIPIRFVSLILVYTISIISVFAYNLKQITGKEKLSSSYVISLSQDNKSVMWIGTNNGLNTYDGTDIIPYIPTYEAGIISGNVIGKIVHTEDNICWIQTYHGLNKFNTNSNKLEIFPQFNKNYFIVKDHSNNFFTINENNCINFYHKQSNTFKKIIIPNLQFSEILNFSIDSEVQLLVFVNLFHLLL